MTVSDWMPFFGDDFWDSERVAMMDDSAVLLYKWLLWRQWKYGPLPGPEVLRKLSHRWQANWDQVWPQVEGCFEQTSEGRFENRRCAEERAVRLELDSAARENGRKGGLASQARQKIQDRKKPRSSQPQAPVEPPSTDPSSKNEATVEPRQDKTVQDKTRQNPIPPARPATRPPPPAKPPRKPPSGAHAEFIAWWGERFKTVVGETYPFGGAKDGEHVKWLLETAGSPEKLRIVADRLLESTYWRREGFDLSTLKSQFPKLLSSGSNGRGTEHHPEHVDITADVNARAERMDRLRREAV